MVSAQSIFTSTGAGGDWTNAASWSENNQGNANDADGIPDGNDNVIISGGLTININTTTGQNVEDLTITTGTLTFLMAGDLDVQGDLVMTGVSNIIASGVEGRVDHQGTTITISAGATATIGAIRFDSNGTLNIDGSLAFSSETGTKIFTHINLASSGTWDNSSVPEDFLIDGNIDVASGGTWSGCSNTTDCTYTMRAATSTISGAGTFAVPDITVSAGDQCTNLGNIVLTDNLTGATGTFINGATGTLTLTENGTYNVGTLTLNTVGNTVIYDGTVNDVFLPGPFYDLEVNMDVGTTILQVNATSGDVTVNNDLTITSGRLRLTAANTLTVGGNIDIAANGELEPNTAGCIVNVTGNVTLTNGLYDQNNGTVNVGGNVTVNSGTFTVNNAASVLDVNGTYLVAGGTNDLSTGTFTPEAMTINSGQTLLMGAVNLTAGGTTTVSGTFTIDSGTGDKNFNNLTVDGTGTINFTVNETLTVAGDLTMSGTSSIPGGNANRIVNVAGAFNVPSGTATIGAFTLGVTGLTTISGNLSITSGTGTKTLDDLTINSSGNINYTANETLAIGGDLTMLGTSSITGTSTNQNVAVAGAFNVTSGTGSIGGVRLTVTGETTVDGTLSFTSTIGVKTFGNVVIGAAGTWDNSTVTEVFTFTGNLTNNGGTWNACANTTGCAYTMTSSSGTINGTGNINVTDFVINAPASITNNGNVVMTDNITGTGAFINGATGTLTLSENGTYSITTLTLNTVGNTVIYDGTATDVLLPGPFYDLQANMDVATTIIQMNGSDVAVNNDLTVTSGRFRLQTANTLTVGGDVIIETNGEFEPNVAGVVATITGNVNMTGGLYDQNEGTVTVSGNFTNGGGALTFDTGTSALNITGNYITSGGATTNDFNTGTLSFVDMTINTGASVNVSSPTITSTGTITVDNGSMTIDGASGTYNFTNVTVNANGSWIATSDYDPIFTNGTITNNGTFTGCNATGCNYTLAGTGSFQGTAAMTNMSDFLINDGASYTNNNSGGLAITDRLATTSGTGTFINGTNGSLLYGGTTGNFSISNFTASANPNTVTYNRTTANQAIEPTTDGFYHSLTIDKADGINATTTTELTINGVLTMTLGDLIMGGQNLIMADGATISGGSATSYIQESGAGVLRQLYAGAGANLSFPIGDTDDYSPISSFRIISGTFGASPHLEFSITDANHPNRDTDNTAAGGDDDGTAAVAFISRYWTVTPNDITAPRYNASYVYVDADVTGTEANMVGVVYRTPAGEAFLDWRVQGTVNTTTNTVTISNMDAFGVLYAMDNTTDRLPIVLMSFDVRATESSVELEWVTASEENNDFFTIERSIDGREFSPVLTLGGADNSDSLLTYSATDNNPLNGLSFYRLKQTDFNGLFDYSEIRSVFFVGDETDLDIVPYPNPIEANGVLKIQVPAQIGVNGLRWKFIDASGRLMPLNYTIEENTLIINSGQLNRGVYIIQATDGSRAITKKIIVR